MYALPYLIFMRLHRKALAARRRDRSWHYLAWSVLAGLFGGVLALITLAMAYALVRAGFWPLALAMVALFCIPVLQPLLQRHVLAPLGAVRAAYWIGHLTTMRDSDALGQVCAAWAHARRPTPSGEAWLAARRDRRRPLGDAEIVVTALLAAARADVAGARELLRSLEHVVEVHPEVRELAGEWLACDAVERGAWAELAADAAAARWPATSLSYLLEGVALRRAGLPGAPGSFDLHARWLLAPYRRATRALLRPPAPAAASPTTVAAETASLEPAEPAGSADRGSLVRALAAQLACAGGDHSPGAFAGAVAAWDAALADDAVRTWLATRALELDAPHGAVDRALRDVAGAVTDELARVAEAAGIGAPAAHGPVSDALARRLRHGRLDALETGFQRWAERRTTGAVRAPIDEWREWCALRASYEAATTAGGVELRRLAFPHAFTSGTQMAAWLWNSRKEYALSHAISAWLLGEALAVGDTEAIDLCTRNVRLTVWTRTGKVAG